MSVLVRPRASSASEGDPSVPALVPMALGVAACDAVAELGEVPVGLKWPNDLVVGSGPEADRKLGGMLTEVGRAPTACGSSPGSESTSSGQGGFDGDLAATATASICSAADRSRTSWSV